MSRVCPCPNPPGGQIVCDDNQLAICGFRDGKVISGCFSIPANIIQVREDQERSIVLSNWVLSMLTGADRSPYANISPADFLMLSSGEFTTEGGDMVRFSLPNDLNLDTAQGRVLAKTH
jgi:hypothetical protein